MAVVKCSSILSHDSIELPCRSFLAVSRIAEPNLPWRVSFQNFPHPPAASQSAAGRIAPVFILASLMFNFNLLLAAVVRCLQVHNMLHLLSDNERLLHMIRRCRAYVLAVSQHRLHSGICSVLSYHFSLVATLLADNCSSFLGHQKGDRGLKQQCNIGRLFFRYATTRAAAARCCWAWACWILPTGRPTWRAPPSWAWLTPRCSSAWAMRCGLSCLCATALRCRWAAARAGSMPRG